MDLLVLRRMGVDYEKGLKRFMGDSSLYETVLGMFLADTSLERAEKAYAEKDYKALFACAHELKGACGNVELAPLYSVACELVELLRTGIPSETALCDCYTRFRRIYIESKEGVREALAG